jgi:hypothetical protein
MERITHVVMPRVVNSYLARKKAKEEEGLAAVFGRKRAGMKSKYLPTAFT